MDILLLHQQNWSKYLRLFKTPFNIFRSPVLNTILKGYNMIQLIRLFLGTYGVFYAQSSVIEEKKNSLDSVELVRICKNLRRKRATSVFRSVWQKKGSSRNGKQPSQSILKQRLRSLERDCVDCCTISFSRNYGCSSVDNVSLEIQRSFNLTRYCISTHSYVNKEKNKNCENLNIPSGMPRDSKIFLIQPIVWLPWSRRNERQRGRMPEATEEDFIAAERNLSPLSGSYLCWKRSAIQLAYVEAAFIEAWKA